MGREASFGVWRTVVMSLEGMFGEAGIKRGGAGDRGWRLERVSLQEELGL